MTSDFVMKILKDCRNGRAADIKGLKSEYLKYGEVVADCVADLANRIFDSCDIPDLFRHGLITPIHKGQDKPLNLQFFYRRITISSSLGQIIDKLHLELSKDDILPQQNPLQRSFTSKTSPPNGSLLFAGPICESLDLKSPLKEIFIDATQAFDRVWHDSMLVKIV